MAAIQELPQPYPPQQEATETMIAIFQEGQILYVLFRAPLQSGKTGTYQYLIRILLQMDMIDQAYITCGSNEIQLRDQVIQDVKEWHGEGALNQTVHVVFRQDFKKVNMVTRRVLIVNDESHLDCQKDQQLHKFLHRHGLSMAGTTDMMRQNQVYMVSVSATPFAEESVMVHGHSHPKAMVCLDVPANYYGPMEYHRDGLLRETFSVLTNDGATTFRDEVQRAWGRNKYVILRIRESAVASRQAKRQTLPQEAQNNGQLPPTHAEGVLELIKSLVSRTPGARILRFTSQYTKERQQVAINRVEANAHFTRYGRRIPSLEVAPRVPTVILLDSRIRCGKRIHKAHIGMVWDSATKSKTDVILQGLLGRMCGYLGEEVEQVPLAVEDRPVIYTNRALFQSEEDATVPLSDLQRFEAVQAGWHGSMDENGLPAVAPRFATHLLSVNLQKRIYRLQDGREVTPCVPLRFRLSSATIEQLTENLTDSELRRLCWEEFVPRLEELVDVNWDLTHDQKTEITHWVGSHQARHAHVRRYTATTRNGYQHMKEAYHTHSSVEKDQITGGHLLTFCTVFQGFVGEDPAGTVYVNLYTEAPGLYRVIPLSSRVAPHNGKTHFIRGLEPEVEMEEKAPVVVAATKYGFTPEIEWSPATFEVQLDYFIQIAKGGIGHFGQKFTSVGNKNGFYLLRAEYGNRLEILQMIIDRLEATHDVRIRYSRSRAQTETHIFLRSVEWD
jgi:hypothetical protein